ncbi:beta-N-acetylhexosaminidase [Sinomonas atrocyanea]|uniref:glycoside hydrolase family 3 N-terminal domain-containing protein n=2 Tax=Sinomonas atrocyanea TaxID=37927 RepID=UPI0027805EDE|nr:glycoside hydrolase family 3 N-terminal domain-containing protein [Sinomonas atrocyanea]MDQ0258349.1 beta-N-acetylhexosaminidase [Sinomonas atrocyanea]
MPHRNWKAWAAVAVGIVAVLAVAGALILPRLLAGPTAAPGPTPSAAGTSPATASPSGASTRPTPTVTPSAAGAPPTSSAPARGPSTTASPPAGRPAQILASMSLEQRVGQIIMVSSPAAGPDAAALDAMRRLHIGNVFLKGRSTAGVGAVAAVVRGIRAEATDAGTRRVGQFIATDQEGGQVQVLRGPGFSDMPTALAQGGMAPAALRAAAAGWGRELAAAGVNVNFAPVMDTVPSAAFAPQNTPIGHFQREFGYTPAAVSAHGIAFAQGMADAGLIAVPKHFPGLGRVTANTDTASGVTDTVTGRHDPFVAPFADAVEAGTPWMMLSNASYPAIDPRHDAVFSPTVIGGMLRGDLGFRGIVVSDDLCDAVQLSGVAPEQRGADFLAAGGTLALCTDQQLAPRIWAGIVARAKADPAFASTVDAAALAVLGAKDRAGLLPR